MNRTARRVLWFCGLIVASCGGDGEGDETSATAASPSGLRMPLVVDVVAEEDDTLYVGQPRGFAINPSDGSFFVGDGFSGRIIRYDREGRAMRIYGRKGTGPGELTDPAVLLVWDTLLVVGGRRPSLSLFEIATGEYVGATTALRGLVTSGKVVGEEAWFGVHNYSDATAFAVLSSPDSEPQYLFALPEAYADNQLVRFFNLPSVAPLGNNSNIAGISGWGKLWVIGRIGSRLDSLRLPVIERRGAPPDLSEALLEIEDRSAVMEAVSILYSLSALEQGLVGIVHLDHQVVDEQSRVFAANVYVSVLSYDSRTACVDHRLLHTEDRPTTAWNADTLFVAYHELQGTDVALRIQGFVIDTSSCRWMPLPSEWE